MSGITLCPEIHHVLHTHTNTHTQCAVTELPLFHCYTNCSLSLSLSPQDPESASNDVWVDRGVGAVGVGAAGH